MRKIDMVTSKPGYTHDKYVLMEKKKLHNFDCAEYLYIKAWYCTVLRDLATAATSQAIAQLL